MPRVWFVILMTLWMFLVGYVWPAFGQTPFLGDVQTYRAQYPTPMSPAQLGELVNRLAWLHRSEGWGLLSKPQGNNCPLAGKVIACDILMHAPSATHWDILSDQEDAAIPRFDAKGPIELSRFVSPVDPGGTNQPPPNTPPPAQVDEVLALIRASRAEDSAQQERIFSDLVARANLDYADRQEFKIALARIELKLREMDERPTWLGRILENRYVQLALVGLGTWLTSWQVTKE